MVLYLDDEDAADNLATMLVNDEHAFAIIVADDCSLSVRVMLSRKLAAYKGRLRCICIDSGTERLAGATPELTLGNPNLPALEKILAENFPGIPPDRIRNYKQYSGGSIRVAADMCCHYHARIEEAGIFGPIAPKLEEYYRERLVSEARMQAVEAVALLKRVKHKGESPTELDRLCTITGVPRHEIEQHLAAITICSSRVRLAE